MKDPESVVPAVLIADDQRETVEALRFLAEGEGYRVEAASSAQAVFEMLESGGFDVVLMDIDIACGATPGVEGLDLLSRVLALDSTLPIVVMTAYGSVELALEAMRRGARDFVQKPWDHTRLATILRTQIELGRALRKARRLEAENRALRAGRMPQDPAASNR